MQEDDTPKPGTHEYDEMMAQRYRTQGNEIPLTADGKKASSYDASDHPGGQLQVRKGSTLGPSNQAEQYTAAQADPFQVTELEQRIERMKAEVAEVARYHPATGEPIYRLSDEQRRLREIQIAHLEQVELPATKQLVATAQAWRAENVESPLEQLIRERNRRDAKLARAQEIADEQEAQAEAQRILQRRGMK